MRNPSNKILEHGLDWFIRLRWFAGGCALFGTLFFPLQSGKKWPFVFLGAAVLLYNAIFFIGRKKKNWGGKIFAHLQIIFDWVALLFLAHYSGGASSPLIPFFIFHVMIVSILLEPIESFLQTTLSIGLITLLGIYSGHPFSLPWIQWSFPFLDFELPAAFLLMVFIFYTTAYLAGTAGKMIREREMELELAYQRLEKEDVEKTKFLLMTAHSLKSPLSTVSSLILATLYSSGQEISGPAKEIFQRIHGRILNLSKLVRDLLYLASARGVKDQKWTPFPLLTAIEAALEKLKQEAQDKSLEFHWDGLPSEPIMVSGDKEEWERVFENILGNAIKYSPKGKKIFIHLSPNEKSFICRIRDEGIGISKEDLSKCFDEFHRAKNARDFSEDGTGLGLSIVRHIVEKYKGTVEIESVLEQGTTVTLSGARIV